MMMTQLQNTSRPTHQEPYVVPTPVEEMADVILTAFWTEEPGTLREAIEATPDQALRPAVERWLLQQMDLEDRDVAEALFKILVNRLQRRVEATTCV